MINLKKLSEFGPVQIGVQVKNVKDTSKLLSVLFGIDSWRFEKWDSNNITENEMVFHYGKKTKNWISNLAFSKLGNLEIELIENVSGNSCYSEFELKNGYGIRHLMFKVEQNLIEYIDYFLSHGFKVSTSLHNKNSIVWAVIDTKNALGFDIEIIQNKGR